MRDTSAELSSPGVGEGLSRDGIPSKCRAYSLEWCDPHFIQSVMQLPALRIARFGLLACLLGGLAACDKNDYTTWSCLPGADGAKVTMVLSRSLMTLDPPQTAANPSSKNQTELRFCGSLGHDSYFDARCPADTQSALIRFTPGSGALRLGSQTMQCTVL